VSPFRCCSHRQFRQVQHQQQQPRQRGTT
jgi:hypothetical protein